MAHGKFKKVNFHGMKAGVRTSKTTMGTMHQSSRGPSRPKPVGGSRKFKKVNFRGMKAGVRTDQTYTGNSKKSWDGPHYHGHTGKPAIGHYGR